MAEPLRRYSRSRIAFDAQAAGVWRLLAIVGGVTVALYALSWLLS